MKQIELVKFSRYPFGRYETDGPYSGEIFREKILLPAFRSEKHAKVRVVLDGARGLGSSFLEESFGGLVRRGIPLAEVFDRLDIVSDVDPSLIPEIEGYIKTAHLRPEKNRMTAHV